MLYKDLKEIVINVAKDKEEDAAYAGERGDGGGGSIRSNLKRFEDKMILKLDLRPSEQNKILEEEVGLPYEFSTEIKIWKGLEFYKENQKKFDYYLKN